MHAVATHGESDRNKCRLLRGALFANAAFSAGCALPMILRPSAVGNLLGIQAELIIRLIGLGLVVFAADLVHQATRRRTATWRALYASLGDFLWVLGTLIGLWLFPQALSTSGVFTVLVIAALVAMFRTWQLVGIDQAHKSAHSGMYRHCLQVHVNVPPNSMWDVVSRLDEIKNHMPMLKSSDVLNGAQPGLGAVRQCMNHAGKSWLEECTQFDDGRGFVVKFLTEEPGFPFPARQMAGGWELNPRNGGTDVTVWWELEPKAKFLVPVMLPMLAFQVDRDFPKVIESMARSAMGNDAQGARPDARDVIAQFVPNWC